MYMRDGGKGKEGKPFRAVRVCMCACMCVRVCGSVCVQAGKGVGDHMASFSRLTRLLTGKAFLHTSVNRYQLPFNWKFLCS